MKPIETDTITCHVSVQISKAELVEILSKQATATAPVIDEPETEPDLTMDDISCEDDVLYAEDGIPTHCKVAAYYEHFAPPKVKALFQLYRRFGLKLSGIGKRLGAKGVKYRVMPKVRDMYWDIGGLQQHGQEVLENAYRVAQRKATRKPRREG